MWYVEFMQAKFYGSLGNISSGSTFYLWGQLHISKALELATLHTVSGSLPNFLTVKSKMIKFLLAWTQQYTSALFWQILHGLHATLPVHVTSLIWKLLEVLSRRTFSVTECAYHVMLWLYEHCCKEHTSLHDLLVPRFLITFQWLTFFI